MLSGCTPWPAEFVERYVARGYWEGLTIGEMFERAVKAYGPHEALIGGGERLTYAELGRRVERLSLHLLKLGLKPRERVVVQLPNIPEFLIFYFALAKIGALPVMALPAHRHTEVGFFLEHANAVGYIIPATYRGFDYVRMAADLRAQAPGLRYIFVCGELAETKEAVSVRRLLAEEVKQDTVPQQLERLRPDPLEVALFLLSGGTTGIPKLIPRTHCDYLYNSKAAASLCGFDSGAVLLVAIPVSHNFALAAPGVQGTIMVGGKIVLSPTTEPEILLRLIQEERVTCLPGVPALHISLMNYPGLAHYDFSSLRLLIAGGAKFIPEAAKRARETFRCTVQQVLGMAEGLCVYTHPDDPAEVVVGTVGRPLSPDDEIRIVDDEGKEVRQGEVGELLCRGPYTIRGYYLAPEHNQSAFTTDGFYRTGDMVRRDERGNLVVEGRKKDLINRGGEKISAEEVENLILSHPKVLNVAVIAMADKVLGERACAYVMPQPGETLTFEELITFLQSRQIARFKLPERLEVVEALPLTSVGKISKKDLREDIQKKLKAEEKI